MEQTESRAPIAGVIIGSTSDWETMRHAAETLERFGVAHERRVISAHRTPDLMASYAKEAEERGLEVIIAGAGGRGPPAGNGPPPTLPYPCSVCRWRAGRSRARTPFSRSSRCPPGFRSARSPSGGLGPRMPPCSPSPSSPIAAQSYGRSCAGSGKSKRQKVPGIGASLSGPVLPGATVGVLGGGQLGRMLALAARRMGYRVHVLSPDSDSPTGQVADKEWSAAYDDLNAVGEFAQGVGVVTLEFENIPAATVKGSIVCSSGAARTQGASHGTESAAGRKVFSAMEVFRWRRFGRFWSGRRWTARCGRSRFRRCSRRRGFGYDGKGQSKIVAESDADEAWNALGGEAVLESWVDFEKEVSVVAARGLDGSFVHYGAVENTHRNHILDVTVAPADVPHEVEREAIEIARGIFEELEIVGDGLRGVLCYGRREAPGQRDRTSSPQLGTPGPSRARRLPSSSSNFGPSAGCRWGARNGRGPRQWRTCWGISGRTANRTGKLSARFRR